MKKLIALILTAAILLSMVSAYSETVITLWSITAGADFKKAIAEVEAAHPGLKIEWEVYENEPYKTRLSAAKAAGTLPDIFYTWAGGYLGNFVASGQAYCLDKKLPEYKEELSDTMLANTTYGGKHYGVPLTMSVVTMFANMDMLKEVGYTTVPETYDELITLCEKLKAAGKIPFGVSGQENWCLSEYIEPIIAKTIGSKGLEKLYSGAESWNQDDVVSAMNKFNELKKYFEPDAATLSNEEVKQNFIDGKYAFYQNGSWNCGDIARNASFTVKACPFPVVNSEKSSLYQMIGGPNDSLAVSTGSADPELCAQVAFEMSRIIARERYLSGDGFSAWAVNYDTSSCDYLSNQVAEMIEKSDGMVLYGDNFMNADTANTYLDSIASIYSGETDSAGFVDNMTKGYGGSGQCGVNATWVLDNGGTLTISGTGDMLDYPENAAGQGQFDGYGPVNTVVISEGITGIGNLAFYNCCNVAVVVIPKTVTRIGQNAFSSCATLTNVNYLGSEKEKVQISIAEGNDPLLNAVWGFAESSVTDFVARCYKLILNRDPDEGGLQGWSQSLKEKTAAAANIIDGFVKSEEFTNRNLSNEAKVDILYQTMLDRAADEGGKAGWVDALSKGYTLQNIIDGFCGSAEFKTICDSYGIEPGSVGAATPADTSTPRGKIEAFVKRCYQLILNRDADQGGLQGWSDALESRTAAAAQIIDGFVRSEEYINRNLSAGESVDVLYKTMLDRAADEGGRIGWVDALSKGYTLQHIINGFCGSAEFTTICENFGIVAGSVAVSGTMVRREAIAPEGDEAEAPVVYKGYNSEFINEERIKAFVGHCYVSVFGREGDAEGVENYTKLILDGKKTPKKVAYEFIFSPEFQEKLPGNEDFIRILYRLYFDREPGAEELSGWVQMLEGGASMEEIVNGFASSDEFKLIVNDLKK